MSAGEHVRIKNSSNKCINCGIDMLEDASPSSFDQKYCIYCQNQDDGSFEKSHYKKVHDFISQKFFPLVHNFNEEESKANATILLQHNPALILRFPCIS